LSAGDRVKVFPHGSPERSAEAVIMVISENQRSIAVAFQGRPPFIVDKSGGMMVDRELGNIVMMATRGELHGKAWGPWVEMMGGGHYEIEAL